VKLLLAAETANFGLWQYSVDLARGLSRLGIETLLVALGPTLPERQRGLARNVPGLKRVETGLALDWRASDGHSLGVAAAEVARIARASGVDLIQLNMPALAGLARFPVPIVAAHHDCVTTWWEAVHGTALPSELAWRTELVRNGLVAADLVVAPTAAFGDMIRRCYGLAESPRVVHYGRESLVVRPGAMHDFAFTAGRLWDQGKNLDMLDAAAGELGVPMRAAGPLDGPDGAVMFDNIHCLGALEEEELARWLAARPVFVSAALYEPFGLAVLEAAAAGCPLILSDIPAFRELWDGVALFLPARDERAFADAISALVGDDFERAVLGRAAKERAARLTPDAMAAQMASLYRSLLPVVRRPVLAAARAA
jgi:glycosyltransferase involved in cell wall biosynthesis